MVPIVLALFTWTLKFEGKRILFRTDNNALVTIINKRTSKSKRVMKLVRPLVLFTMCNNMQFKAVHVEGSKKCHFWCIVSLSDGQILESRTKCQQRTCSDSFENFGSYFQPEINCLLYNSLAPSTMKSYQHSLQSFLKFRVEFGLLDNWLVSENELMNFVSYLYKRGFFLVYS